MQSEWPKTLDEAVEICLLTMSPREKETIKNTSEDELIKFHFDLALTIRNKFGMWQGNNDLLRSCGSFDPDEASNMIVKAVWNVLNYKL